MTRRAKKYYAPQNIHKAGMCDHPGCGEKGEYRAPKDRSLREYYWFCLKHVQEYNAKWNYYAQEEDPYAEERAQKHFSRTFKSRVRYQFGYDLWEDSAYFDDGYVSADNNREYSRDGIYFTVEERRFIKILELDIKDITPAILKAQYKKMAKKYHPDLNQEDLEAEEKFKQISEAYHRLKDKFERLPNYSYSDL